MKPTRGECHKHRASGMASLAVLLLLLAATTAAFLLAPNLVTKAAESKRADEEKRLKEIADAFIESVRLTSSIPGATNWAAVVADHTALSMTNVLAVYPEFPSDTSTRRVMLIDPSLGASTLPYTQGADGLTGTFTNLATPAGRAMLISSTKRGLSLPVTNGLASSSTVFNNIWNWGLNSATKAPPSGWPSIWTGQGTELHVQRIKLNELFDTAQLRTIQYSVNGAKLTTALSLTSLILLDSTLLTLYETNGAFYGAQRITKDIRVDLTSSNTTPPTVHFKFSEDSGAKLPIATNSGTYGSLWDGIYTNGVLLAQTPLRPPTFPGFATNNLSTYFDGLKSYVETNKRYTNVLPAFTIAAWISPEQFSTTTIYIAGIRTALNLNIYKSSKTMSNFVRLSSKLGGSLATHYPYPLGEWHHIAVIGTGTKLESYIDGVVKKSISKSTLNYYYSNLYTFRIGANPAIRSGKISWGTAPQYKGGIDEVVFYDRALTTNEIKKLASGVTP